MQKKLILFDIDGTLFDVENKCIPSSTIKALKILKERGHELALATGRAKYNLDVIKEILPLFSHDILINGQHVLSRGEDLYKFYIPLQELTNLIKSLDRFGLTYGFQAEETEAINHHNPEAIKTLKNLSLDLPLEDPNFYLYNDVYQIWCFAKSREARIIALENPAFNFIKWFNVGYDIVIKGESKGKALKILSKHLQIKKENIIVFGDGNNDIELIKKAGLGIAMGNATNKLKEASDFVTKYVSEDGIEYALKHFKLI